MYFGENYIVEFSLNQNDLFINQISSYLEENSNYIIEKVNFDKIKENIFDAIINFFKKLATIFNNFLLNINYFKNAKLPKQKSDDLVEVLKTMKPLSLNSGGVALGSLMREMIKKYEKFKGQITISKLDHLDINLKNINIVLKLGLNDLLDDDISTTCEKLHADIKLSKEGAENTKAYQRLQEDNYDTSNIADIPLTNIIPDLKNCNTNLTNYAIELGKLNKATNEVLKMNMESDSTEIINQFSYVREHIMSSSHKLISVFNEIISYYKSRIQLLNNFFKSAQASIKAIGNNIKNIKNSDYDTKGNDIKFDPNIIKSALFKKKISKSKEIEDLLKEINTANKEKDFDEYRKLYSKLCNEVKAKDDSTLIIDDESFDDKYEVSIINNSKKEIHTAGKKLYHYTIFELENNELRPNAASKGRYFPSPRVYVNINIPKNLYGESINDIGFKFNIKAAYGDDAKEDSKIHIYEVIGGPYKTIQDPEYAGVSKTAVYIETDKPLKVKEIDIEQWKQENNLK